LHSQAANFQKVKIVIDEKDNLIQELEDQLKSRELLYSNQLTLLREELRFT
jgi:Sperm tail